MVDDAHSPGVFEWCNWMLAHRTRPEQLDQSNCSLVNSLGGWRRRRPKLWCPGEPFATCSSWTFFTQLAPLINSSCHHERVPLLVTGLHGQVEWHCGHQSDTDNHICSGHSRAPNCSLSENGEHWPFTHTHALARNRAPESVQCNGRPVLISIELQTNLLIHHLLSQHAMSISYAEVPPRECTCNECPWTTHVPPSTPFHTEAPMFSLFFTGQPETRSGRKWMDGNGVATPARIYPSTGQINGRTITLTWAIVHHHHQAVHCTVLTLPETQFSHACSSAQVRANARAAMAATPAMATRKGALHRYIQCRV